MTTHRSSISPHPVVTVNRAAKAVRCADFIQANPLIFGDLSVNRLADFPPETWRLINTIMGEPRVMSDLTVAMTIGILAGRA